MTVDPELVDAANRAVANGSADSLSAWVSAALVDRAKRDAQLARLGDAIADYEAAFGEITADEITRQRRTDRQQAVVATLHPLPTRLPVTCGCPRAMLDNVRR